MLKNGLHHCKLNFSLAFDAKAWTFLRETGLLSFQDVFP
jgi:hypothetical protein